MNMECACCHTDLGPEPAVGFTSKHWYCGKCAFYQGITCCPVPPGISVMDVRVVESDKAYQEMQVDNFDHELTVGMNCAIRHRTQAWELVTITAIEGEGMRKRITVSRVGPRR